MSDFDNLPQDLIPEILKRLPVNSLLRFRSVCKQWRDLIDSPNFAKSQLSQATKSKSTTCVVFHNGLSYNLIHLSSLHSEVTPGTLQKLDFPGPIQKPYNHTRFLGSINGLMCVYIGNRGVVVWNPSIGTKWIVPDTNYGFEIGFAFWFWGFGYDSVCDDYKVIRIASVPSDDVGGLMNVFVWIYSFKNCDWRRISDLGHNLEIGQLRGVFLQNAVHWVVSTSSNDLYGSPLLIGALDMRDEEFRILPGPGCKKDNVFLMCLADLNGSLCACYMHKGSGDFDLWLMKEYGVKESWNRVIRLDFGSTMLVPVTLSEDGKEILVDESFLGFLLWWYDAETGLPTRKVLGLSPVIGVPCVHIPSLVRVDV